ncbi:MAG TPA: NUDIX hydrolase [Anaerolineales bacterium]|nr:NUDIX hydrolase [Anaerolineales bacterium]
MPDLMPWETLKRTLILDRSPWMRVFEDDVRLPNGRIVEGYLHLDAPGYVMIVPVSSDAQIGLVRSYKRGVDGLDIQPPAGMLDQGENPLKAAKRELQEELGCLAETWYELGDVVLSGNYFAGYAHFFLATGCRQIAEPDSGDLEEQEVIWLPFEAARRTWSDGGFRQVGAVAALGLAFRQIEKLGLK